MVAHLWRDCTTFSRAIFMCFYSTIILAFGPYINVSNWTFIIIAIVITPIAFYINHHFYNKDANTRV